jgi:nitroreductase
VLGTHGGWSRRGITPAETREAKPLNVIEAIYARRSVRKYQDKPVEKEKLLELCRLGAAGPSATNKRPWAFVIVEEKEAMEKLRKSTMFGRYSTPAAIVVCGDMRRTLPVGKTFWLQDCSAGMENILLGAVEMGLGAVWIGVMPIKLDAKLIARALGLPRHIVPLGIAYIGYPAEEHEPRTQFEDDMVRWNKWD